MRKDVEIKQKFLAIDLLKILKDNYTYEEIGRLLKLPIPVISRYVNGHVLPSLQRAQKIIEIFKERCFFEILRSKVVDVDGGVYDLSRFIRDVKTQKLIAKMVFNELSSLKVDKVLTAAVGGVPLGAFISDEFGADLVIATSEKGVTSNVLEEKAIYSPGAIKYFYIPKDSIRPNESVLIVDDIARTGMTIESLIRLVERSKGRVSGIFAVYEINDVLKRLVERHNLACETRSFIKLK